MTPESKHLEALTPGYLPSHLTLPLVTHLRGYSIWASLWLWVYNGLKVPISESNRTHLENSFGKEAQNFSLWQELCLSGYLGQGERVNFRETSRLGCLYSHVNHPVGPLQQNVYSPQLLPSFYAFPSLKSRPSTYGSSSSFLSPLYQFSNLQWKD